MIAGLISFLAAQGQMADPTLSPQALKEDLKIARGALEEGHPGVYRYTSKPELDAWFDNLASRLDHPITSLEFYRELAPVVSVIKCGHTGIGLSAPLRKWITEEEPLIPIEPRILGRKLYCLRSFLDSGRPLIGRELLSINGVRTGALLGPLLAARAGDADIQTGKAYGLGRRGQFSVSLRSIAGLKAPFRVLYRTRDGKVGDVALKGEPLPKIREQMGGSDAPPAQLDFKDEGRIALITVRSFGGSADKEGKKPLGQFFDEAFADIAEHGSGSLIIDVRGNGGGEDAAGKELLAHLLSKPFRYYDELLINTRDYSFAKYTEQIDVAPENMLTKLPNGKFRLTGHPNWGTQQPASPGFIGKVIVLEDGGSFSTTCEFTSNLREHKGRATFVGEEGGGCYYGNNSGPEALLVLPNSKVRVAIPLMEYVMAVTGPNKRRGAMPDVPVKRTIEDEIAGRDPDMEVALNLALRAQVGTTPKGSRSEREEPRL